MEFDSELMRGVVEPIVLRLVAGRAMYGYEIIKVVNEQTKGAFAWKEGTLYPCLHRLEADGLVSSEWRDAAETGKQRKYYSITRKGTALLKAKTSEWTAFAGAVNAVLLAGAPA